MRVQYEPGSNTSLVTRLSARPCLDARRRLPVRKLLKELGGDDADKQASSGTRDRIAITTRDLETGSLRLNNCVGSFRPWCSVNAANIGPKAAPAPTGTAPSGSVNAVLFSSDSRCENFPRWLTIPRKRLRAGTPGAGIKAIALVFSGSGDTPSWLST